MVIIVVSRSVTVAASRRPGSRASITYRVARSTRVITALEPRAPMTRSPSQCPATARSLASAGRAVIAASPTQDFPRGRAPSFEAGTREVRPLRRAFSRASSARRLPRPCTYSAW